MVLGFRWIPGRVLGRVLRVECPELSFLRADVRLCEQRRIELLGVGGQGGSHCELAQLVQRSGRDRLHYNGIVLQQHARDAVERGGRYPPVEDRPGPLLNRVQ